MTCVRMKFEWDMLIRFTVNGIHMNENEILVLAEEFRSVDLVSSEKPSILPNTHWNATNEYCAQIEMAFYWTQNKNTQIKHSKKHWSQSLNEVIAITSTIIPDNSSISKSNDKCHWFLMFTLRDFLWLLHIFYSNGWRLNVVVSFHLNG